MSKNNIQKKNITSIDFIRTAVPISVALALIFSAAGFIVYKLVSEYNYNERWKDYDECGLS